MSATATARAHPNIALVKYWGKRDVPLNLPAAGSVSITLDTLETRTRVAFDPDMESDTLTLDGRPDPARLPRVKACLDRLRRMAGVRSPARIDSHNNFPTAAGLASSASGFAALVTAADEALGLGLNARQRSVQARLGSGSAARSIFGGFVLMHAGRQSDGLDAFAEPLMDARSWPLNVVVAITSRQVKSRDSSEGMTLSRATSPFYESWVATTRRNVGEARSLILQRDFAGLAEVAEASCLRMHAVMLGSRPGLVYWNGATVEGIHRVRALRAGGTPAFFTIDAGPQLKVVCLPEAVEAVQEALADIAGVDEVITTGLGGPAASVDDSP